MNLTGSIRIGLICLTAMIISGLACSDKPAGADDYQKIGMKAFTDGRYTEARASFLKALAKKPSDKDLLYFTSLAYQRDFIMDSAFYYMKRAYLLHPQDREIVEQYYEVASTFGEYNAAREALMSLIEMGDSIEKHIALLVEMLEKSGSVINTYYYLRLWYLEYGLNDLNRFRLLASLAGKIDSFQTAHTVLDSAISRWGDSDDLQLVRSEILFNEKRLLESESILRELVAKYPDNNDFKMNLASSLSNQGNLAKMDEALTIMRGLVSLLVDSAPLDSVIIALEERRQALASPSTGSE